jgi:ketosteroid isomerase-like protein
MSDVDIEALEDKRCRYMMTADTAALADLLDDSLIWVHSSARQDSKSSFIAGFGGAGPKYVSIERSQVVIRTIGDAAIVNGLQKMHVVVNGQDHHIYNRYLNVWIKRGDDYRLAAWQSTSDPKQAG